MTARWVQAHRSETRVVILSGYDEIEYVHAAIESESVDFLVKPVAKDALIRAFEKVRKKLDGQKASRYSRGIWSARRWRRARTCWRGLWRAR